MVAANYRSIEWGAGEVIDNAAGAPGIFTSTLENILLNDQKHIYPRPALDFIMGLTSSGGNTFSNGYFSLARNTQYYAYIGSDQQTLTIYAIEYANFNIKTYTYNCPNQIKKIFFLEMLKSQLRQTVDGVTALLVSGLDLMKFIDDRATLNDFGIYRDSAPDGYAIYDKLYNPKDAIFAQGRLVVAATGPSLSYDANAISYSEQRILMSRVGFPEHFDVVRSNAPANLLPIDAILTNEADQEIYALSSDEDLIFVTTSIGTQVMYAGDQETKAINSANVSVRSAGYGAPIREKSLMFSSFLIIPERRALRAKMLQSLQNDFTNTADLMLPLLSDIKSDIVRLQLDRVNQQMMIFCQDGTIHNLATQSIIPSKSYALSLPKTASYKSPGIQFIHASGANPNYFLVRVLDGGQPTANYAIIKWEDGQNNFGSLIDGAGQFSWSIEIETGSAKTFSTTITSDTELAKCIDGMWLETPEGYVHFATLDGYNFRSLYDIDMSQLVGQTLEGYLIISKNAYKLLPSPFNTTHAICQYDYDLESDTESYELSYFTWCPVEECGNSPISPEKPLLGSITMTLALSAPEMVIGWRDPFTIGMLSNVGGIRCVLSTEHPYVLDYIEFYASNSTAKKIRNANSAEITLQTARGSGYDLKTISARSKCMKVQDDIPSFQRLVGQY